MAAWYVPMGHTLQTVEPGAAENCPTGHTAHSATLAEYWPAGHTVHADRPVVAAALPGVHAVHTPPVPAVPAGHAVHAAARAEPTTDVVPLGHTVQDVMSKPPTKDEYVPMGHTSHKLVAGLSYRPAVQATQAATTEEAAGDDFPAAQSTHAEAPRAKFPYFPTGQTLHAV